MTQMSLQQAFVAAIQHHQAGRFQEAEGIYRQILSAQPNHPDAMHLLGVLASQLGRFDVAIELIRQAISVNPQAPSYYCNLGQALLSANRAEEAVRALRGAMNLKPNYPEAENNLGSALQALGQRAEAIRCFKRVIAERPTFAEAYNNLGNVLREDGQYTQSIDALQQAISLKPEYAAAFNGLGSALRADGQLKEAISAFRRALSLKKVYPEALNNLGNALHEAGDNEGAISALKEAAAIGQNSAEVRNNLGSVYRDTGRLEEAIEWFDQALALQPKFADAHNNRASSLQALGRIDDAIAGYRAAIDARPNDEVAHVNLGITLLLKGDVETGWREYEWRWRDKERAQLLKRLGKPRWNGEQIKRQRLLLHAEQGFGDTIQFVRYLPMVAERSGAKIILQVQPQLVPLIEGLPHVNKLVEQNTRLPDFEFHCPLLSLPSVLNTNLTSIPTKPMPYLQAPKKLVKRWVARMAEAGGGRKIGIVWAGQSEHLNDKNRSMPLAALAPLSQVPNIQLFNLQKGMAADQLEDAKSLGLSVIDWTRDLTDFAETAALMQNLDLIITVDTAAVHLAGALARPTFLLLPFVPDWRWLLDRADSPWYPSVTIFRQPRIGDWATPVKQIVEALSRQ
jgi:tetratricopeptide (TPR) repeat protein